MKMYMADRQIRLVGKAWEIRHHLKKALEQAPDGMTLLEYTGSTAVKPSAAHKHQRSRTGSRKNSKPRIQLAR